MAVALHSPRLLETHPAARREITSHTFGPVRRSHERVGIELLAQQHSWEKSRNRSERISGDFAGALDMLMPNDFLRATEHNPIYLTRAELAERGQKSSRILSVLPEGENVVRLHLAAPMTGPKAPAMRNNAMDQNSLLRQSRRNWGLSNFDPE